MNVRSKTADRALDTPDTQGTEMLQGKPQVSPLTFTGTKQECVKVLRPLDMAAFRPLSKESWLADCQPARLMTIVNENLFPTKHSDAIMKGSYARVPQGCRGIIYASELLSHRRDGLPMTIHLPRCASLGDLIAAKRKRHVESACPHDV